MFSLFHSLTAIAMKEEKKRKKANKIRRIHIIMFGVELSRNSRRRLEQSDFYENAGGDAYGFNGVDLVYVLNDIQTKPSP